MRLRILLGCCLYLYFAQISAAESDSGAWSTLSLGHRLSANKYLTLDLQSRHSEDFEVLERFLIRPYLTWRHDESTNFTAGYDAHFVESPNDLLEHRLWQRIDYTTRWSFWSTTAHLWLEERFIEDVGGVAFRLRPAFQLKRDLDRGAYFRVQNEIHFQLNSPDNGPASGLEQNRLIAAGGMQLSQNTSIEVGYLLQFLNRRQNILRHHIMVTLKLKIPN